ncbi:hypothetical protein BJV78DRAFT_62539 [Lactifluus subvellereus]|nr:hypothetical protein BJV78DRAFT_62539 [Lactifluus subvellereus]
MCKRGSSPLSHRADMPTLPQGRLLVLSFSIILSCAIVGVSIILFCAPKPSYLPPSSDGPTDVAIRGGRPNLNFGPYFGPHTNGYRVIPILGMVSSVLNIVLASTLLIVSAMRRKTIVTSVAIEAPCIYVVSFVWLATGAYTQHNIDIVPFIVDPSCTRRKVLAAVAFINWVQLMLYANTLMTVATICHVRKRGVWLRTVAELPTFSAPALTFDPKSDTESDSPFMTKTNESEIPILGGSSRRSLDTRTPSHFRTRIPFLSTQPGTLSTAPSPPPLPLPLSHSDTSLVPTAATQSDLAPQNTDDHPRSSTGHHIAPIGDPPTYSNYELVVV